MRGAGGRPERRAGPQAERVRGATRTAPEPAGRGDLVLDTGEFSRMARVSKRTLRYYDSIDLFKPIRVDEGTGVRYYSTRQLADLNRILALKELGMSLDQIRRMLADDVSPDEIRGMLLLKKAEAEQALLADIQRFRSIEARLQNPDTYLMRGVVLKSVPRQPFLSYRSVLADRQLGKLSFTLMEEVPRRVGRDELGPFTSVMHGDAFDAERFDAELGFLLPRSGDLNVALPGDVVLTERTLPAVEDMASVVLVGGPSRYPAGFSTIGRWVEENGYEVVGPQREIFLETSATGDEDDMVIEIQFPVTRPLPDAQRLLSASTQPQGDDS